MDRLLIKTKSFVERGLLDYIDTINDVRIRKSCKSDLGIKVYSTIIRMICDTAKSKSDEISKYYEIIQSLLNKKFEELLYTNLDDELFTEIDQSWLELFRNRADIKEIIQSNDKEKVSSIKSTVEETNSNDNSNSNKDIMLTKKNAKRGANDDNTNTNTETTNKSTTTNTISHSPISKSNTVTAVNQLKNNTIREILEFIHVHIRFLLNKNGLGYHSEHRPSRLSIFAILNGRLMDYFKAVLLSQSFREKLWPIVESGMNEYKDIVPWLKVNKCPYIYNEETVKTANVYGIYRFPNGDFYKGHWKDGKRNGEGIFTRPYEHVYEGSFVDDKKNGFGKCTYSIGHVYEGSYKNDLRHGHGMCKFDDGKIYIGSYQNDERNGQGKCTWPCGSIYIGDFKNGKLEGNGTLQYSNGRLTQGSFVNNSFLISAPVPLNFS